MSTAKWTRACPGLYVDPTETWVVNNEGTNWYSIRAFLGWGATSEGKMLPEYGSIWHGDYRTLAEAKAAVDQMVKNGEMPALEPNEEWRQTMTRDRLAAVRMIDRLDNYPLDRRAVRLAHAWESFPNSYTEDQVATARRMLTLCGMFVHERDKFLAIDGNSKFASTARKILEMEGTCR